MHFDTTINLGTLLSGMSIITAVVWAAATLRTKVDIIERKLDTFITRAEVSVLKAAAETERAAILDAQKIIDSGLQSQINGIRTRLDLRNP